MKRILLLLFVILLPAQAQININDDGSVLLTKDQIQVLGERIQDDKTMIEALQKEVWKMKMMLKAPKICT